MNARVEWMEEGNALRDALRAVLGSALFARAPRTCKLLAYLIEMKRDGKASEISERAIGLAVFRRDARTYATALDPVVRVQMGRLRARLAEYAATQSGTGWQLCIPLGTYVPVLRAVVDTPAPSAPRRLQLAPLRNLTGEQGSQSFVAGVDEELGSRLFHAFGSLIQLPQQSLAWPASRCDVRHRLEGSIRVEKGRVRASMRLVDTRAGDVAWLSQIDCSGELGMNLQDELAAAICGQVQSFLSKV
jgi:TolB-like protein